jgi:hypothetical protein
LTSLHLETVLIQSVPRALNRFYPERRAEYIYR